MSAVDDASRVSQVNDETLGQKVSGRRADMGFSVRRMAEETGVSRESIAKIERDDPSLDEFTVDRYLSALDRIEKRLGMQNPDHMVNVIELPDGTKVTFTGTSVQVADAAAAFLAHRDK